MAHGTEPSPVAVQVLQKPENQVLTCPASLAEIVSVLERRGLSAKVPPLLEKIRRISEIVPLAEATYENAGRVHARERSFHRDFSLADALILAQAKEQSATVLTTDRALAKNHQGVVARLA